MKSNTEPIQVVAVCGIIRGSPFHLVYEPCSERLFKKKEQTGEHPSVLKIMGDVEVWHLLQTWASLVPCRMSVHRDPCQRKTCACVDIQDSCEAASAMQTPFPWCHVRQNHFVVALR